MKFLKVPGPHDGEMYYINTEHITCIGRNMSFSEGVVIYNDTAYINTLNGKGCSTTLTVKEVLASLSEFNSTEEA